MAWTEYMTGSTFGPSNIVYVGVRGVYPKFTSGKEIDKILVLK